MILMTIIITIVIIIMIGTIIRIDIRSTRYLLLCKYQRWHISQNRITFSVLANGTIEGSLRGKKQLPMID